VEQASCLLRENGARCEIQPTKILSRGSSSGLTVLIINLFAVLSQKIYVELSPFMPDPGVSKY
jgi:hypothetical protein